MKRGLIFLLAILYITLTSGIVVNIHYCMGRIAGVSYGHEAPHACSKCGMEEKDGCCETEHKLVKADNDHIYAKHLSAPITFETIVKNTFPDDPGNDISTTVHFGSHYHSPPDYRNNHLEVYNSVFRI